MQEHSCQLEALLDSFQQALPWYGWLYTWRLRHAVWANLTFSKDSSESIQDLFEPWSLGNNSGVQGQSPELEPSRCAPKQDRSFQGGAHGQAAHQPADLVRIQGGAHGQATHQTADLVRIQGGAHGQATY